MDLNLQDFQEKYLNFKQKHDEFVKEYEKAMSDKMMPVMIDVKILKNSNSTLIQAKNSTQIYKDKMAFNNFKLTQNQQILNVFSMLFSSKNKYGYDFSEAVFLKKHSTKWLKSNTVQSLLLKKQVNLHLIYQQ